ncbi:GL13627 [Drosophila persimilis]|uniref:GL13627 n=2 Tax=Drosophila persimilis TaxID=7234 RepID=B4GPE2_DROPE|nr:GL13627 [Drosophila persimilis]
MSTKKYDKDGYLRPQLTLDATDNNRTTTNATALDDNYVLHMLENKTQSHYVTEIPKPMLSTSTRSITNSKVTVFPDSLGKQLGNDILADEADDYDDDKTGTGTGTGTANGALQKAQRLKQLASVAFAPITVLTKPDRPDNWVIYNKASEEPPLPQPPTLSLDVAPTGEVPTPIRFFNNGWKKQDLKAIPETAPSSTTKTDTPQTATETDITTEQAGASGAGEEEGGESTTVAASESN